MKRYYFKLNLQYKQTQFKSPVLYLNKLKEITQDLNLTFPDQNLKEKGVQGIGTFISLNGFYDGEQSETDLLQNLQHKLNELKMFPATQNINYKKIEFEYFSTDEPQDSEKQQILDISSISYNKSTDQIGEGVQKGSKSMIRDDTLNECQVLLEYLCCSAQDPPCKLINDGPFSNKKINQQVEESLGFPNIQSDLSTDAEELQVQKDKEINYQQINQDTKYKNENDFCLQKNSKITSEINERQNICESLPISDEELQQKSKSDLIQTIKILQQICMNFINKSSISNPIQ
ncbi:hypothetical protein ABPG74_010084 [Tetrahymena malaccensis]